MGCPEILIHAYVTSRIGMCKMLRYDHNQYLVNRFKTFHNPGMKTVTGACKCDLIILAIGKTAYTGFNYWFWIAHSDNFPAIFSDVFCKKYPPTMPPGLT